MAWSVLPLQRTRLCGIWRRSCEAGGRRRGSRRYDGHLALRGRRLYGLRSVGEKERGNMGFDRAVFQDAVQSEGSHSSGKIGCHHLGALFTTVLFFLVCISLKPNSVAFSLKCRQPCSTTKQRVSSWVICDFLPSSMSHLVIRQCVSCQLPMST